MTERIRRRDQVDHERAFHDAMQILPPEQYVVRIEELEKEKDKWKKRALLFQEAWKEKDFEIFALELQNAQLEARGTDAILIMQRDSLKLRLSEACKERNTLRELLQAVSTEE